MGAYASALRNHRRLGVYRQVHLRRDDANGNAGITPAVWPVPGGFNVADIKGQHGTEGDGAGGEGVRRGRSRLEGTSLIGAPYVKLKGGPPRSISIEPEYGLGRLKLPGATGDKNSVLKAFKPLIAGG